MKHNFIIFLIALPAILGLGMAVSSCGIYSFSGTSIQPDVKTVTINYFEYKALNVNPMLASQLTEAMKEKFRRLTKLEEVEQDGDLDFYGEVTGYAVSAVGVTADETVAQNRLTVTVKIQFTDRLHSEEDFEKTFSAYADFDSSQLLDTVQDALCEEIVEKLVEDIFNASVAQW